jgi:hypothetical protein
MEMKLPKSLIVGIWVVGIGLVLNGVQPFIGTPANAQYGVQKVAICDVGGDMCADIWSMYSEDVGERVNGIWAGE